MSRKFLIPLLAAAFLAAPAFAPAATGVADTAAAATAVKSSKSNTSDRVTSNSTKKRKFITKDLPAGRTKSKARIFDRWGNQLTVRKAGKQELRRMGGGGGKGGANKAKNLNSSRSN